MLLNEGDGVERSPGGWWKLGRGHAAEDEEVSIGIESCCGGGIAGIWQRF